MLKPTQDFSPYGSFHKQEGEGKTREKGNAWLVVPFTVSSVFVSLYLSHSKLTKDEDTRNSAIRKESLRKLSRDTVRQAFTFCVAGDEWIQ